MDKNGYWMQIRLAAVLLTRLPLPHVPSAAFAHGARAVWAYSLIGLLIGCVAIFLGQIALWLGLPALTSAALVLCLMMLLTGAMHEDGLADVFDGFWGGNTPARRLEIMRDSQIGTYGVLALGMVTLLRVSAIAVLLTGAPIMIVAAAAASRAMMPIPMYCLSHARGDGLSRSVGRPARSAVLFAGIVGAVVLFACVGIAGFIPLFAAATITAGMILLAKKKIGGQTGDV